MENRGSRGVACGNRHLPNRSMGNFVKIACVVGALLMSAVAFAPSARSEYFMTDLGTLGGTGSEDMSWAHGLNDMGQVVGKSYTKTGEIRGFVWDSDKGMSELGSYYVNSLASDINNLGQIVGYSDYPSGYDSEHAVLWELPNVMIDLGALVSPDHSSRAASINDQGVVVGWERDVSGPLTGNVQGLIWVPDGFGGYSVGSLPGAAGYTFSAPSDINILSAAVGASEKWLPSPGPGGTRWEIRATVWKQDLSGEYQPAILPQFGDVINSWATSISDTGIVAGYTSLTSSTTFSACVWIPSGTWYLPPINLNSYVSGIGGAVAYGVNDNGQVVGSVDKPGVSHAWMWSPDNLVGYQSVDLGTLGGSWSYADRINNLGEVVGASNTASGALHAFKSRMLSGSEATATELTNLIDKMVAETKMTESVGKVLKLKVGVALEMIKKWSAPTITMGAGGIIIEGGRKSGGTQPIVGVLTSFSTQVSAFVCSGKIQIDDGQLLTSMANDVIASLISPPMISGVPAYYSYLGCGPTAGGMVIGYWDTLLGSDCVLVAGSAAGGSPTDPLGNTEQVDNMVNALAGSMGTTGDQTVYTKIGSGLIGYADNVLGQGWTVNSLTYKGPDLTWDVVKQEIGEQHPMVFFVDSDVDGAPDHFVTVIGYCELDNAKLYAFYSTYDFGIWWASFDSNKKGNFFGVNAGVSFDISVP